MNKRFLALDALRGFAACAVAIFHFGILENSTAYLAVDFFLVLSGFVLTHSYFRKPGLGFFEFAYIRFARLYPLHLATTLIALALCIYIPIHYELPDLFLHVAMIHNIGFGPNPLTFNHPSWSISVEFWTNMLVFAGILLVGPVSLLRTRALLLVGSLGGLLIITVVYGQLNINVYDLKGVLNSGLLRGLTSFCLGILTYQVYLRAAAAGEAARPNVPILAALLLAVFFAILTSPWPETRWQMLTPLVFCVIVYVFAVDHSIVTRTLSRFSYFGDISFSIYLLHYPIVMALDKHKGLSALVNFDETRYTVWASAVFLAVLLGLSHLSYRYFEIPIYRYLRAKRVARPQPAGEQTEGA